MHDSILISVPDPSLRYSSTFKLSRALSVRENFRNSQVVGEETLLSISPSPFLGSLSSGPLRIVYALQQIERLFLFEDVRDV